METILEKRNISIAGRDFCLSGDPNDHYFNTLPKVYSDHEALFSILNKHRFDPHVILDVGASLGLFTLGANVIFPSARIFCYEPHKIAYDSLVTNTKAVADKVNTANCALGCEEGSMYFHPGGPIISNRSSGAHLMNESHWKSDYSGIRVSVSTLDAQIIAHSIDRVDLLKVDVEGFELDVLQGETALIEAFSPLIHLEFNSWALVVLKNINPRTFIDYLGEHFSYVYRCNKDATLTRLVTGEDHIRFLHDNLIAHGCVDDLFVSNTDYLG